MSQQPGKLHIAFIKKVADHIHAQTDFTIPYEVCITTALQRHREKLAQEVEEELLKKTDPYYGRRRTQQRFKDTVKIPIPPRIPLRLVSAPPPIPMSPLND